MTEMVSSFSPEVFCRPAFGGQTKYILQEYKLFIPKLQDISTNSKCQENQHRKVQFLLSNDVVKFFPLSLQSILASFQNYCNVTEYRAVFMKSTTQKTIEDIQNVQFCDCYSRFTKTVILTTNKILIYFIQAIWNKDS